MELNAWLNEMYGAIPLTAAAPSVVTIVTLSDESWRPGVSAGPVYEMTALSSSVTASMTLLNCCTTIAKSASLVTAVAVGADETELQLDGSVV